MKTIKDANKLFRDGFYKDALHAYRKLSQNPKFAPLLHANINLCRRRLGVEIEVSIIVPVYNSGKYLKKCLESILSQVNVSFELIIINDGSSDDSPDIINKFFNDDSRILFLNNSKASGNPGTPRNQGIAIASGQFIGFVDSDDWIDADYFMHLLNAIRRNNSDIAFSSGYTNHLNDTAKKQIYNSRFYNSIDSELAGYHESFMIWDKIYRTDLIKKHSIRLGETKAAVDVPFIFKAYYFLRKAAFAETTGYHYRRESESSVTVNYRKLSNCEFEIQAYADVEKWCISEKVSKAYQDLVAFRKLSSYIYTLKVISPDHFPSFFAQIYTELKSVNANTIRRLSEKLKKPGNYDRYKSIISGDLNSYVKQFRPDLKIPAKALSTTAKSASKNQSKPPETKVNLSGANKGILFFPDWSHANPYQKLFYASLAQNYDIKVKGGSQRQLTKSYLESNKNDFAYIHLHWLHVFIDMSNKDGANNLIEILKFAKKLGYKIIYTAHNIVSHDSKNLSNELVLRRAVSKYFDHVIAHGQLAKNRIIDEIGILEHKIIVMPHGTYQGYYQNYISKVDARKKLGIDQDKFVLLFFGNIKGYKGVEELLEKYQKISIKRNDVCLVIAGRFFDEGIKEKICEYARNDSTILIEHGYIADCDVQIYFNSSDLVILPYKRILTSGAAMLSIAFERPVIAPRSGLIPELIQDGNQGYLFEDYDDMFILMNKAIDQQRQDKQGWKKKFNFSNLNSKLRWPILTSQEQFRNIFGGDAKTNELNSKTSQYRYALVRILGNDLPERHSQNQTYDNLKFQLENEHEFDHCIKIWVLNRILDGVKKSNLIELLVKHRKRYIDIPYDAKEFSRLGYCFSELPCDDWKLTQEFAKKNQRIQLVAETVILRNKNNYIINNNGARNVALEEGKKYAEWVFPWDGNCFLTEKAWACITKNLLQRADLKYHLVPMERLLSNQDLFDPDYVPNPVEEPQIIFRKDSALSFDEERMYGQQPKVELFKRLGVPGIWDNWKKLNPWGADMKVRHNSSTYNYGWAGWTSRLFSGSGSQEVNAEERAIMRSKGIVKFISDQDKAWFFRNFDRQSLNFFSQSVLDSVKQENKKIFNLNHDRTLMRLSSDAEKFLACPNYSVMDKTTLPPSGDKKDYWHPAPYYWPNPDSSDGLPYIRKDGMRVPGTRMYEQQSNQFDRTSIQRVFDETLALALAGDIYSNLSYTEKAIALIRTWFLNKSTAMNPHLKYAQVVMGKNNNYGTPSGIIETKDLYFFLDAVRIVSKSHLWREEDEQGMIKWCIDFLSWLNTSQQGQIETVAKNNHGIAFDLQTYALAAFIGDQDQMYSIILRTLSRLKGHFDKNGMQPHEMSRNTTAHYTAFNLHLWFNLSLLIKNTSGLNILSEQRFYDDHSHSPLKKATSWLLTRSTGDWPFKQIDKFDKHRYQHLYHIASIASPSIKKKFSDRFEPLSECKVVFFPHDGIAPYWTLSCDS